MLQFQLLEAENEKLMRDLMFLQEQNALAQNRRKSDKEGNKRSHDRPYARSNDPDNYLGKHKDSIPGRYIGKPDGSRESNKTVSLVPDDGLTEDNVVDADQMSTRSCHSEPAGKPKEKVVHYKAYHYLNGGFHIEKVSESGEPVENTAEVAKRPHKVPPLDLRNVSSPRKQDRKKYKRSNDKENRRSNDKENRKMSPTNYIQPSYFSPVRKLVSNWDNYPFLQKPYDPLNTQLLLAANSGLPYSKSFTEPSPFKPVRNSYSPGKRSIIGFHGIIDPSEYTFYHKPLEPVESPHIQQPQSRKVRSPQMYKPTVVPGLPRQQMHKNADEDPNNLIEDQEQNNLYHFKQNDNDEDAQESEFQQPDTNDDSGERQSPSNTEGQQLLPSNTTANEDGSEFTYTPGGSPVLEESDDDVSLGLPHYDRDDDDDQPHKKNYYKPYM